MTFKKLTVPVVATAAFTALAGSASAATLTTNQACYTTVKASAANVKIDIKDLPGQSGDYFMLNQNGEDLRSSIFDPFDSAAGTNPNGNGNHKEELTIPALANGSLKADHTFAVKKAAFIDNIYQATETVASDNIIQVKAGLNSNSANVKVKRGKSVKFTINGLNANVPAKATVSGKRGFKTTFSGKLSFGKPTGDCRSLTSSFKLPKKATKKAKKFTVQFVTADPDNTGAKQLLEDYKINVTVR